MIDIAGMADDLSDAEFALIEEEYSRLLRKRIPPFSPEADRYRTLSNLTLYRWLKADMDDA